MRVRAALLLLAAALPAGAQAPIKPRPQWPAPPDPARLQFVEEIAVPESPSPRAGAKATSWLKLLLGVESAARTEARAQSLLQPTGLFARDGVLYVADPARGGVLRYDLANGKGRWLNKPNVGGWVSPVAVATSADGRTYILDSLLKKVFILDAKGKPAGELHGDSLGLGQPAGLAVSEDRVYVSDVRNHRIMVYGLEGIFAQAFGRRGTALGEFNYPTYLWFDHGAQQLWVTDSGNFRLQWFDRDGRLAGHLGMSGNRPGYLARPRGVARDSEGHVYVNDGAFDALQIFDAKDRLLLFVGRSGTEPGEFDLPGGVFIDEKDRVFVADTQNGRVQVFQYYKEAR